MSETASKKTFRDYIFFMFGQQFSLLGSLIIGFSITWWLTVETGSALILSISSFLMFVPQVIIAPFAGVLTDRMDRKKILLLTDSGQAILTFGLFLFFLTNISNVWIVLTVNTFRSMLFAVHYPAFQAIIPAMIPKDKLSRINGANMLFGGLVQISGPVIAAFLLNFFQLREIFFIDIATFFIALIPLLVIRIPPTNKSEEDKKSSFRKDFKEGFKIIKNIPGLLALIVMAMIFNVISRPFYVLMPYFIKYIHLGTALDLSLYMAGMQTGSVIGSLVATFKKEWKHKVKLNLFGLSIIYFGYLLITFSPQGNFIFMSLTVFGSYIIFPITISTYLTILQTSVPSDKIGRVMSIDHTISMAIAPIGALIVGPVAELMGIRELFLISSIMGLIYPLVLWFFTRIRELDPVGQKETTKVLEIQEIENKARSVA